MFRHLENVLEQRRSPTHTLRWSHSPSVADRRVPRTRSASEVVGVAGVQTCYRRVCACTPGYWDSSNPALTLSLRCCGAVSLHVFRDSPLFRHALVPSTFRLQVSRLTSKSTPSNFAQLRWEFSWCVPRRTLSPHPALPADRATGGEPVPFADW